MHLCLFASFDFTVLPRKESIASSFTDNMIQKSYTSDHHESRPAHQARKLKREKRSTGSDFALPNRSMSSLTVRDINFVFLQKFSEIDFIYTQYRNDYWNAQNAKR